MTKIKRMDNVDVFNQVRNHCSQNFKSRLPKATQDNFDNLSKNMMTNATFSAEYNEFIQTMVNKIAFTIYRMNTFKNKYSKFVYYDMPIGEIIEEVAVRPARGEDYVNGLADVDNGVNMDRISKPTIETVYYSKDATRKYRVTIMEPQIVKAFNNTGGLSTLISQCVNSLSEGCELDEYETFKQVLNSYITQDIIGTPKLDTQIINLDEIRDDVTAKKFIMQMKTTLSQISRPTDKFNPMKLVQAQRISEMTAFVRDDVLNFIDIEVLSSAFNKSDLNLSPNSNIMGGGLKVDGIDNFGGELPLTKDGDNYTLLYTVYDKYGKVKGYSKTDGGALEDCANVHFIPNYRFETQPTYTTGQPITRDIVAMVFDDRLPVIAIEREHFGVHNNIEGIYYNNVLVRMRKYGYSPMINCFIIYENRTTV